MIENSRPIALAKSRSTREASHQPVFMGGCLTMNHTCLPILPTGRTREGGELGKVGG